MMMIIMMTMMMMMMVIIIIIIIMIMMIMTMLMTPKGLLFLPNENFECESSLFLLFFCCPHAAQVLEPGSFSSVHAEQDQVEACRIAPPPPPGRAQPNKLFLQGLTSSRALLSWHLGQKYVP